MTEWTKPDVGPQQQPAATKQMVTRGKAAPAPQTPKSPGLLARIGGAKSPGQTRGRAASKSPSASLSSRPVTVDVDDDDGSSSSDDEAITKRSNSAAAAAAPGPAADYYLYH